MARNVFISFRYKDGLWYKNELAKMFDTNSDTVDYSENQDRSSLSEDAIRWYLYRKLKHSSVTIILLSPLAIEHETDRWGNYDDWMYDEIRYSLEDRENNRMNGLIAVYTPEAGQYLFNGNIDGVECVKEFDNLVYRNMMNVKTMYKTASICNVYDVDNDSYCSLVSWDSFINNINKYINLAIQKRNSSYRYDIVKR